MINHTQTSFFIVCAFFRCLIDSLALISIRIKGRRALEDQGVSISKIKRRGQIRSRIKRYKPVGKLSIFYKQYIKIRDLQLSYLIGTKRRKMNKKHLPLRGRGSIVGVDIVLALTKITIRDGGRTVLAMFTNLVKADM